MIIPKLLLAGIQNSIRPEHELERLDTAARKATSESLLDQLPHHIRRVCSEDVLEGIDKTDLTIEVADLDELAKNLSTKSDGSRLSYARRDNSWGFEKRYEPYEHKGIESIGISMSTNPYSGRTEASLKMKIHPEVSDEDEDSIIASLIKVREVGSEIFRYQLPRQAETRYKTREGKGRGVVFTDDKGTQTVIELSGHILTMTQRDRVPDEQFDIEPDPDLSDEDNQKRKDKNLQEKLEGLVKSQLEFVVQEFPAFIQHVTDIWDGFLPSEVIQPKIGKHGDRLGLFDDERAKSEIDSKDVPESVTDGRQRELYVQTVRLNPKTTFDMVGGLDHEVKRIRRAIKKATSSDRYETVGLDPRATVLLIGPPGTGKTMLAEAVANEISGTFLAAKGSDIMSMWAGEAEKNVAALFDLVEVLGKDRKVVLFLDEIEAVAPSRGGIHMMEFERKITAEFLAALNRKYPNAVIIGATNAPANVDAAVTRPGRFTDIITIGNPDGPGRAHILNNWIDYYKGRASIDIFNGVEVEKLAEASEGLNGADLRTIIETALVDEVEDAIDEEREFKSIGTVALLKQIRTHATATAGRFANYLHDPNSPRDSRFIAFRDDDIDQ